MATKPTGTVIHHNPSCTTSRKVLGMRREAGAEPRIVEYLETLPSRAELLDLPGGMGMTPRTLLRRRGTPHDARGLADPSKRDATLADPMLEHRILIERPIVKGLRGVRLCRPAERVYEVLPAR
jgi:arsenate reductase